MKKLFSLSLLTFFLGCGSVAFGGANSSGGGPSILCRGADGKIATAQLLDLYEGNIRYNLTIRNSDEPVQSQIAEAFDRLKAYDWFLASDIVDMLKVVERKIAFLPLGVIMAPGVDLGDSYAALIPDGCELAYAGYYEADGTLRISQTIYDHFDNTSKAALFMHEALYKVARDFGELRDSLNPRTVNSFLFSTTPDLSPVAAAEKTLYWPGHFQHGTYNGYNAYVPVLTPQLAPKLYITTTVPEGSSLYTMTTVGCFTEDGSSQILFSIAGDLEGSITQPLSTEGCRAFSVDVSASATRDHSTTAFVGVEIKYGEKTVVAASTKHDGYGVYSSSLHAGIPVYLDRPLTIPSMPLK